MIIVSTTTSQCGVTVDTVDHNGFTTFEPRTSCCDAHTALTATGHQICSSCGSLDVVDPSSFDTHEVTVWDDLRVRLIHAGCPCVDECLIDMSDDMVRTVELEVAS